MKVNADLAKILDLPKHTIEAKLEMGIDRAPILTVTYYLLEITPEMLEKISNFVIENKDHHD